MSSSNYPPGVTDAIIDEYFAEPPIVDVDVVVSTTLSKPTVIETSDVNIYNWMDSEVDEDGYVNTVGGTEYEYDNCDFVKDYKDTEYTIEILLKVLEEVAKEKFEEARNKGIKERAHWKKVLESCKGWVCDELEVIKD